MSKADYIIGAIALAARRKRSIVGFDVMSVPGEDEVYGLDDAQLAARAAGEVAAALEQAAGGGQDAPPGFGIKDGRGYGPYNTGYYDAGDGQALPLGPAGEQLPSSDYDFQPGAGGDYLSDRGAPLKLAPGVTLVDETGFYSTTPIVAQDQPQCCPPYQGNDGRWWWRTADGVLISSNAHPDEVRSIADQQQVSVQQPARVLPSALAGVSDEQWTKFVLALKTGDPATVTDSGALGMWAMKPRRLVDLGLMKSARMDRDRNVARWTGEWIAPLTQDAFLSSPEVQYRTFCASIRLYAEGVVDGDVPRDAAAEQGMTMSGALAVLHKCGPRGLVNWADEDRRKSSTSAMYDDANGIF